MPITTAVQFYFDPVCPWTWITSRWLVEVADHRDLQITWNQYSLRYHNKTNPAYDWLREEMEDQYPGMRVVAATKQHHGNAAVGRLNTTLGTLIHHDGDDRLARLAEGIAAAGLPADLIEAGSDAGWDAVTRTVEVGKEADLLLLDANPLMDITNTKRIHAVVRAGRVIHRATLDSMVARDPRAP